LAGAESYAGHAAPEWHLENGAASLAIPGWEFVADTLATFDDEYILTVPTFVDSGYFINPPGPYCKVLVIAHTQDPASYYESEPDSGYSVDNIAPGSPTELTAVRNFDGSVRLSWLGCSDSPEDFGYYEMFRSQVGGFVPNPSSYLGATLDRSAVDQNAYAGSGYYYAVRGVDQQGNRGPISNYGYAGTIVPVALSGFNVTAGEDGVLLEWSVAAEMTPGDFYVHRSAGGSEGTYTELGIATEPEEKPGSLQYSYLDATVVPGTLYYYKLESREPGGGGLTFGPYPAQANGRVAAYSLDQNIPNPFGGSDGTTIHYSLAAPAKIHLMILDATGRLVKTLVQEGSAGQNRLHWDGTDNSGRAVTNGVYFYSIDTGAFSARKKMVLVN